MSEALPSGQGRPDAGRRSQACGPDARTGTAFEELARLGAATVYEASGRQGLIDADLLQIVPGSRACGPARTARCGQDDNLMVHAAMARLRPGEVLVLSMPEPAPVALVGELLATQAQVRGAAAILVDASVRDSEELAAMGLPVWARWIRSRGATKDAVGELDVPVRVGGQEIRPGDLVVLDADGATVVAAERAEEVLDASLGRERNEAAKRAQLQAGELSYELDGLRARVEARRRPQGDAGDGGGREAPPEAG